MHESDKLPKPEKGQPNRKPEKGVEKLVPEKNSDAQKNFEKKDPLRQEEPPSTEKVPPKKR